jgi:hypothetical protein
MRVPTRVRLADDDVVLDTSSFSLTGEAPAIAPRFTLLDSTSIDTTIPSYQLSLTTPLGSAPGAVSVPTNAPSTTNDWFKALPSVVTSGAVLAGTIARIVQGPARPATTTTSSLRLPTLTPGVPLARQPLVWIGGAAVGLVVVLALMRN